MRIRIEFNPGALWVGVLCQTAEEYKFVMATGADEARRRTDVWVCLIPMLPVHLVWWSKPIPSGRRWLDRMAERAGR